MIAPIGLQRSPFSFGLAGGPSRSRLGQAISQGDRDHYLIAVSRALAEGDEIDAWIKDNPDVKVRVGANPGPGIVNSPYYTKWANYVPHMPDLLSLKTRLEVEDPMLWSSLTQEEHTAFGWVSVVDQVYSSFKADPKNLLVGRWDGQTRLPDEPAPAPGTLPSAAPATSPYSMPLLIGAGLIGLVAVVVLATR